MIPRPEQTWILLRPAEWMPHPRASLVVVTGVQPATGDPTEVGYRYLSTGARGVLPGEEFVHRFQWQGVTS